MLLEYRYLVYKNILLEILEIGNMSLLQNYKNIQNFIYAKNQLTIRKRILNIHLTEQIYKSIILVYICVCDSSTLGVGTGTLDGLADFHTRLAIYPNLTIHYQRVVICALLDIRFKGRR